MVKLIGLMFKRDEEKARKNRRIITGLKETIHYVKFNKAQ